MRGVLNMQSNIYRLTDNEYRILKYISKFHLVSKQELAKKFSKINITYCLQNLCDIKYHNFGGVHLPIETSFYISPIVKTVEFHNSTVPYKETFYKLSPYGEFALSELKTEKLKSHVEAICKSVIVPIIVSIITTLIIATLKSLLS